MIGDNRTICRNDFDKNKYYTEDNIVYYPCYTNIEYCGECINKNTCTKCINNYGFLGNDRNKCYLINSNEYYTEDDGISFYPCSYNLLNCEQCLNKTTNHFITINNETKTISQWCEEYNIKWTTFYARIKRGWDGNKLLKKVRWEKFVVGIKT